MTAMRERLHQITGGGAIAPLVLIFLLNVVDEFDQIAFGVLAPPIRDEFGLSDAQFTLIVSLAAVMVILMIVPAGYLADRWPRIRMAVSAGIIWSTMSVMTGLAPVLVLLILARFGSGLGRVMNEPVHASLLADYYPRETHGRVYAFHRMGAPIGTMMVLGAGVLANAFGWRMTFVLLAIPTWVLLLFVMRLREPPRGRTINEDLAVAAEAAGERVPLGEAYRTLAAVGTLKRLWGAAFFLGAAVIPIATIFAFFYEQVYNMDDPGPAGRAGVMALFSAGGIVGLYIHGHVASRAVTLHGDIARLTTYGGRTLMGFGAALALMAIAPVLWLSLVFTFVAGLFGLGFQAYNSPLIAATSPPRLRSQGFAYFGFYFALGALLIASSVAGVGETEGYRIAMFALALIVILSGLIYQTARQFVVRDMAQAGKSLEVAARVREQHESGEEDVLLRCEGVEVAYGQVQVLFGVDLEVHRGETVALLGTNGAGKSTLLNAVSGTVDPVGGAVFFDGRDITHASGAQTAELGIAQVPGGKAVFPTLTVSEHLRLAGWLHREDEQYLKRVTREVYDLFPRLHERRDQLAGNLSGGEQQMLGLAMAFMADPKLLVIDELSLGLAPAIVEELLEVVRRIQATGVSIVIVEQSINVALTIADRAYFLEKGEVRFEGPTEELLERDDIVRSVFLASATDDEHGSQDAPGAGVGGNGASGALEHASREQLYELAQEHMVRGRSRMSKAELAAALRELVVDDGDAKADDDATQQLAPVSVAGANGSNGQHERVAVLELEGVRKRFGGITAVDGTSLQLFDGEILGLIGPNGAGKTTIFDLISGFEMPNEGRIVFCGVDITPMMPDQRSWLGLGRSFQDARLVPSLTVAENLAISLERHLAVRDHFASMVNLPAIIELEKDIAWSVSDLIELMNLGAFRDKFVRELSTGSRRIVDLAMCIAHEPRVLLLDEPSSGIAQREAEALGPLMHRIRREAHCSLLVIEHDMPLITGVSDRMIALELGRPLAEGTPTEVTTNQRVITAYLGGDPAAVQRSGTVNTDREPANAGTGTKEPS